MDARIRPVTALAALIGTILIGTAAAQAELTAKGDEAAWEELNAAFKKLDALSAYRQKTTSTRMTRLTEIVLPSSVRIVDQIGAVTREYMNVNGHIRVRTTGLSGVPNGWHCAEEAPLNLSGSSGGLAGTADDVSRGPDTTIEGMAVRTYAYLYTKSEKARTLKATTYVDVETGLPRRSVTATDTGEVITDYYDYGAKIEITLPPCE